MKIVTAVHIRWFGAYSLDHFYTKDIALHSGIYAIYRVYGEKETLLYIGKTSRNFWQRISEHNKDWLWNVKGKIKIRLGLLEFPDGGRYSAKKLADVESLLILWHLPKENTTSTCYYRGRVDLEIINFGRRGLLDKKVTAKELDWV
ncbi:GIY-YIG nuclease family protein [Cytobacillus dafuensis]|uniref:GIY-YIG nuclease family protein n=1 Tax=Cytobacillus dafuensis TaxID=1742359 RepID=A0A5B8ZDU4_CYTDA|nr:GIY-YIG nuclease family protein [Cytobacillus dafuensis]QED50019.1 GIY-YIG nuclease family protein [Cytobacillus dafuensis]